MPRSRVQEATTEILNRRNGLKSSRLGYEVPLQASSLARSLSLSLSQRR